MLEKKLKEKEQTINELYEPHLKQRRIMREFFTDFFKDDKMFI
jgi:hypothetical protein